MTRRHTDPSDRSQQGFTLIELLIVTSILGVLAALAIQQFSLYRIRAFDATAEADLRNAATAEEAMFITTGAYVPCASAADCDAALNGYTRSPGVQLAMHAAAGAFTGTSEHIRGSKMWTFDTTDGRLIFAGP